MSVEDRLCDVHEKTGLPSTVVFISCNNSTYGLALHYSHYFCTWNHSVQEWEEIKPVLFVIDNSAGK